METGFNIGSAAKDSMLLSVGQQAKLMGRRVEFSKTALANFLKQVGVDVGARDKKGGRVWRVPNLEVARSSFDDWIGGSLDWGQD